MCCTGMLEVDEVSRLLSNFDVVYSLQIAHTIPEAIQSCLSTDRRTCHAQSIVPAIVTALRRTET